MRGKIILQPPLGKANELPEHDMSFEPIVDARLKGEQIILGGGDSCQIMSGHDSVVIREE